VPFWVSEYHLQSGKPSLTSVTKVGQSCINISLGHVSGAGAHLTHAHTVLDDGLCIKLLNLTQLPCILVPGRVLGRIWGTQSKYIYMCASLYKFLVTRYVMAWNTMITM